ncbi:hypothetical protein F0562_010242 [Nyssa sinensis]|uniref:Uncharacterized protein n=1 Tax=Nyssa sinensis TaxID=561372 RepID=A0A5J5A0J1_9ASTE|nr:hypothetical protein F0562_010242 [Nyssa sinensis]
MGKTACSDQNGLKKGPWTAEEDKKLIDYIQKHGHGKWRTVPKNAGLKRWSAMAARLPGRTDNEIKNYWNTHIRKRLLRMGIDPVTHSPRVDLLELPSLLSSSLYNSSQLNVQNLLGIQSAVNPNLLNLTISLLSSHYKNLPFLPQNLQENQFCNPQVQDQFQPWEENQLQSTIQQFQACTTSTAPLFNDTKLMQAQVESSLPNLYQYNEESSNIAQSATSSLDYIYNDSNNQSFIELLSENLMLHQSNNIQNFGLSSVLSTPASLSTNEYPLLQSSSKTYVNGSTEDERDVNCSTMMFEMANSFGCL